jgi:hypothetical protein
MATEIKICILAFVPLLTPCVFNPFSVMDGTVCMQKSILCIMDGRVCVGRAHCVLWMEEFVLKELIVHYGWKSLC